jgi:hypothetical protein
VKAFLSIRLPFWASYPQRIAILEIPEGLRRAVNRTSDGRRGDDQEGQEKTRGNPKGPIACHIFTSGKTLKFIALRPRLLARYIHALGEQLAIPSKLRQRPNLMTRFPDQYLLSLTSDLIQPLMRC